MAFTLISDNNAKTQCVEFYECQKLEKPYDTTPVTLVNDGAKL